jgi:hypothetical protein
VRCSGYRGRSGFSSQLDQDLGLPEGKPGVPVLFIERDDNIFDLRDMRIQFGTFSCRLQDGPRRPRAGRRRSGS